MSTTRKIERKPVPSDNTERFMVILYSLLEPFGIDKIPEVMHYVELIGQAVDRHLFEQRFGTNKAKDTADQRRFVSVFRQRYLQMTDFEYTKARTPVEGHMMKQAIKKLREANFEVDDYLTWLFEQFLPDNPKFCPPTIKTICGDFFISKFMYEHRDERKVRAETELRRTEEVDLANRGRALVRAMDTEEKRKKVVDLLKAYSDECIMFDEFRKSIEDLERQV